jgi:hypothetical protein
MLNRLSVYDENTGVYGFGETPFEFFAREKPEIFELPEIDPTTFCGAI